MGVVRGTISIQHKIEPGNVASDDKAIMGGGDGARGSSAALRVLNAHDAGFMLTSPAPQSDGDSRL